MTMETSDDLTSDEDVSSPREILQREVPSGDLYLTDERYDKTLVSLLLSIGDDLRSRESFVDIVTQDSIECLSPWAMTVPNPTYAPHVHKKKPGKSAEDGVSSHRPMLNSDLRQNSKLRRALELENYNASHYKQCVEPTTYRYTPNNGSYRLSKISPQNSSPSMNVRRMKSLDKYISPQQRVVQREVQRSMRKELQKVVLKEKDETEIQETAVAPDSAPTESPSLEESTLKMHTPVDTQEIHVQVVETDAPLDFTLDNEWKVVPAKEHNPVQLPAVDIPLVGRQISDKLIDNFSKRINVLDEEIRKDVKVHRRNADDMIRSKSEPARVMSQGVFDLRDTPRENDNKPAFTKQRRHEPIAEDSVAQPYFSKNDLSPRKGALLYKVGDKGTERVKDGSNSAPTSYSDIYDRHNVTPGSEKGGAVVRHAQPRRTMSFDQNMIQRAKLHRDFRLSSQTRNQYVRNEAINKTTAPVKSVQPKLKVKTVSNSSSSKHVPNNFAQPVGKSWHKESEQESYDQELLPGVSGRRLEVSVINHRLL